MKLLLAALAVTFTIAVTAAVFAIWPAVADAPWEAEPLAENNNAIRCEAALSLRESLLLDNRPMTDARIDALGTFFASSRDDIDTYC